MTDEYAQKREDELIAEAQSWNTDTVREAKLGDIPVIDVSNWLSQGGQPDASLVEQLRSACEQVGFFSLIGHGVSKNSISEIMLCAKDIHNLPLNSKMQMAMDQPGQIGGIGYLPVKHQKLPKRATGNENEAFLVKRDLDLSLEDNLWPDASLLPEFQSRLQRYADEVEALAKSLLPLYAAALDMPLHFFNQAFSRPLYRLRLTHYPVVEPESAASDQYGIAPHVDTTFFTILAQNEPGLAVFSEQRQCWIQVPLIEGAFVVNTGELLKQWTNDRFLSVKHFANNKDKSTSRYSVPFFFNANSDYPMACIASCTSDTNPPRYPTVSYAQGQGVVQGE